MKNIIQSLKVVALGLMLAIGLSYAFAWTAPTGNPPSGNVSAPVNVSGNLQTKAGDLWSDNFLGSQGGGYFGGDLEVENGKGITLGGEYKTSWPSGGGGAVAWSSITDKPAGFADNVDDTSGTMIQTVVSKTSIGISAKATAQCLAGYIVSGGSCTGNINPIFTTDSLTCSCYKTNSKHDPISCSITATAVCIKI